MNEGQYKKWANAGFAAYDAKDWHDAGFFNVWDAKRWQNAGFTADEAKRWHDAGFTIFGAKNWRDAGFSPTAAKEWADKGYYFPKDVPKDEKATKRKEIAEKFKVGEVVQVMNLDEIKCVNRKLKLALIEIRKILEYYEADLNEDDLDE